MISKGGKLKASQKKNLILQSDISLIVNSYEDIFSDFDPRPYSNKALSVDFLDEAKRATRELSSGAFELKLLVPKSERNFEKEKVIVKRLNEHSKKHYELLRKEKKKVIIQGYSFVLIGIFFMVSAAYVLFHYAEFLNFWKELLVVMLEPGGWFLFWEGLDLIIFVSKQAKPDLEFYRKMTRAKIVFSHY